MGDDIMIEKNRIIRNAEANAACLYGELNEIKETMDGHFDDEPVIDSITEILYQLKDCIWLIRNIRERIEEEFRNESDGKKVDYGTKY